MLSAAQGPRGGPSTAERRRAVGPAALREQPLEHRMLLTATMCLLAFGAVMVYSASSATTLLQGGGYGSSYLLKFVVFGGVGLVLMHVLARDGVAKVHSITAPLLFALVRARARGAHPARRRERQRRAPLDRPGTLQFQPSELLKIALVLYSATLLARRPSCVHDLRELARPLLLVVGAACLLVFTQPDLGTAMVIAFTVGAMLIAWRASRSRKLALVGGSRARAGLRVRARCGPTRGRA